MHRNNRSSPPKSRRQSKARSRPGSRRNSFDDNDKNGDAAFNITIQPVGYNNSQELNIPLKRMGIKVKDVLKLIEKHANILEDTQQLYYNGLDLAVFKSLKHYGIRSGSTIYLKNRLDPKKARADLKQYVGASNKSRPGSRRNSFDGDNDDDINNNKNNGAANRRRRSKSRSRPGSRRNSFDGDNNDDNDGDINNNNNNGAANRRRRSKSRSRAGSRRNSINNITTKSSSPSPPPPAAAAATTTTLMIQPVGFDDAKIDCNEFPLSIKRLNMSIKDVLVEIQKRTQIPTDSQLLHYHGKDLAVFKTLKHYNIQENDLIYLKNNENPKQSKQELKVFIRQMSPNSKQHYQSKSRPGSRKSSPRRRSSVPKIQSPPPPQQPPTPSIAIRIYPVGFDKALDLKEFRLPLSKLTISIKDVLTKIHNLTNIPTDAQQLYYNGKDLAVFKTLKHYNIQENDIIYLKNNENPKQSKQELKALLQPSSSSSSMCYVIVKPVEWDGQDDFKLQVASHMNISVEQFCIHICNERRLNVYELILRNSKGSRLKPTSTLKKCGVKNGDVVYMQRSPDHEHNNNNNDEEDDDDDGNSYAAAAYASTTTIPLKPRRKFTLSPLMEEDVIAAAKASETTTTKKNGSRRGGVGRRRRRRSNENNKKDSTIMSRPSLSVANDDGDDDDKDIEIEVDKPFFKQESRKFTLTPLTGEESQIGSTKSTKQKNESLELSELLQPAKHHGELPSARRVLEQLTARKHNEKHITSSLLDLAVPMENDDDEYDDLEAATDKATAAIDDIVSKKRGHDRKKRFKKFGIICCILMCLCVCIGSVWIFVLDSSSTTSNPSTSSNCNENEQSFVSCEELESASSTLTTTNEYNIGTQFYIEQPRKLTHIRIYGGSLPAYAQLWNVHTGELLAQAPFTTTTSGSIWHTSVLLSAVTLVPNTNYIASVVYDMISQQYPWIATSPTSSYPVQVIHSVYSYTVDAIPHIQPCCNINYLIDIDMVNVKTTTQIPDIIGALPYQNGGNGHVYKSIRVYFDKAMDSSTIDGTTNLNLSDNHLDQWVYDSNTWSASYTLTTPLNYDTLYTMVVNTNVKDVQGLTLSSLKSWYFYTMGGFWRNGTDIFTSVINTQTPRQHGIRVYCNKSGILTQVWYPRRILPNGGRLYIWNDAISTTIPLVSLIVNAPTMNGVWQRISTSLNIELVATNTYTISLYSSSAIHVNTTIITYPRYFINGETHLKAIDGVYGITDTQMPTTTCLACGIGIDVAFKISETNTDSIGPFIINVNPPNATLIPRTTIFTVYFNEALNTSSVTTQSVLLYGASVSIVYMLEVNSSIIIIRPTQSFVENMFYYVRVTNSVTDMAGNALQEEHIYIYDTGLLIDKHPVNNDESLTIGMHFHVQQPRLLTCVHVYYSSSAPVMAHIWDISGAVDRVVATYTSFTLDHNTWWWTTTDDITLRLQPDRQYILSFVYDETNDISYSSSNALNDGQFPLVFGTHVGSTHANSSDQVLPTGTCASIVANVTTCWFLFNITLSSIKNTTEAPSIIGEYPYRYHGNAPIDEGITVYFDKSMNPSTIMNGWTYDNTKWSATYSNTLPLDMNYTVFIPASVSDIDGNSMLNDHTWWFWTYGGLWRTGSISKPAWKTGIINSGHNDEQHAIRIYCNMSGIIEHVWYPKQLQPRKLLIWNAADSTTIPLLSLDLELSPPSIILEGTWQLISWSSPELWFPANTTVIVSFVTTNNRYINESNIHASSSSPYIHSLGPAYAMNTAIIPTKSLAYTYDIGIDVTFKQAGNATNAPYVITTNPLQGATRITPSVSMMIQFKGDVNASTITSNTVFFTDEFLQSISASIEVYTSPIRVYITPTARLGVNVKYRFGLLTANITDYNGLPMQTFEPILFTTEYFTQPLSTLGRPYIELLNTTTYHDPYDSYTEVGFVLKPRRFLYVNAIVFPISSNIPSNVEFQGRLYSSVFIATTTRTEIVSNANWSSTLLPQTSQWVQLNFNPGVFVSPVQEWTISLVSSNGYYGTLNSTLSPISYPVFNNSIVFTKCVYRQGLPIDTPPTSASCVNNIDPVFDIVASESAVISETNQISLDQHELLPQDYVVNTTTMNVSVGLLFKVSNYTRLFSLIYFVPSFYRGYHNITLWSKTHATKELEFVLQYTNTDYYGTWRQVDLSVFTYLHPSVEYALVITPSSKKYAAITSTTWPKTSSHSNLLSGLSGIYTTNKNIVPSIETTYDYGIDMIITQGVVPDSIYTVYGTTPIPYAPGITPNGFGAAVRLRCTLPGYITHVRMWKAANIDGPFRIWLFELLTGTEMMVIRIEGLDMGTVVTQDAYWLEKELSTPIQTIPGRDYDIVIWSPVGQTIIMGEIPSTWPLTRGPLQVIKGMFTYNEYGRRLDCAGTTPCHYGADAKWIYGDLEAYLAQSSAPTPVPTAFPTVTPTPYPTTSPTVSPTPLPTPSTTAPGRRIPHPIYGITLEVFDDSLWNDTLTTIKSLPYMPTVRFTFESAFLGGYTDLIDEMQELHPHAYIMCPVLDMRSMSLYTVKEYKLHIKQLFDTFGVYCDVWEVGQSINAYETTRGFDANEVALKLRIAHEMAKSLDYYTSISILYNGQRNFIVQCWSWIMEHWATWIYKYIPQQIRYETNYAFINYFDGGCDTSFTHSINWTEVFNYTKAMFPRSYVGLGGVVSLYNTGSKDVVERYYQLQVPTHDYVGGGFYYGFVRDMVNITKTNFSSITNKTTYTELNETIIALKQIWSQQAPPSGSGAPYLPHVAYPVESGNWDNVGIVRCYDGYDGTIDSLNNIKYGRNHSEEADSLIVGDGRKNQQYKAFVSCSWDDIDTSNMEITGMKLVLSWDQSTQIGRKPNATLDPLALGQLGDLRVDIQPGHFGSSPDLEVDDFTATALYSNIATTRAPYTTSLFYVREQFTFTTAPNVLSTNTERFQLRLSFSRASDNDAQDDYVAFYSGASTPFYWPAWPFISFTYKSNGSPSVAPPLQIPTPAPSPAPSTPAFAPSSFIEPTITSEESACQASKTNAIAKENCRQGTLRFDWDIPRAGDPNIEGFTTQMSYDVGETVYFKINSSSSVFTMHIYRMGYYDAYGARLVASTTIHGHQQQPSCTYEDTDPSWDDDYPEPTRARMYDCDNWHISAAWDSTTHISGVYFVRIRNHNSVKLGSHIFFVIRNDVSTSDMIIQTSDSTWQAYNYWGGSSVYTAPRAYYCSYNRPMITRTLYPENSVFNAEYSMIRFVEKNGYDVTYTTNVDAYLRPERLKQHKLWVTSGHDEYWSQEQRDAVREARESGVHLGIFSANSVYWGAQWRDNGRKMQCLKDSHQSHPWTTNSTHVESWTGVYRDISQWPAYPGSPENALIGNLFMVNGQEASIQVPKAYGNYRIWRNTGISTQTQPIAFLGVRTLGYEWDEDIDQGFRPPGSIQLSYTTAYVPLKSIDFGNEFGPGEATHTLLMYKDQISGALVFGSGTVQWSWGLDIVSIDRNPLTKPDPRMKQATVNFFAEAGCVPETLENGLIYSGPSTDTTPPTISFDAGLTVVTSGQIVLVNGSCSDAGGGLVAGVEFSSNDAMQWNRAQLTVSETQPFRWTFPWHVPTNLTSFEAGVSVILAVRATDDSLNTGAWVKTTVTINPAP